MRISRSPVAATVAIAVLATACGGTGAARPTGPVEYEKDGTFTVAITDDPGAVNPYTNYLVLSEMGYLAYDSLVNPTVDGEFVSGLALSWDVRPDGVTFTLTKNVTCSDGHRLAATDVAAALKYLGDPKNGSVLYGSLVPSIPYTVTADDTRGTVKVATKTPFSFLLQTIGQVPILCPAALRAQKQLNRSSIGTGPFVLSAAVPGDRYTFTRREDYTWGPDGATTQENGLPKTVVVRVVQNQATAANLLLSGDVNMAFVDGPDRERLVGRGLAALEPRTLSGELWFNERDGRPGSEESVRRALVSALDLDEVARVATSGHGERATGLSANSGDPCRVDIVKDRLPAFDADGAGTLLDKAGWTLEGGFRTKQGKRLTIDLHFTTESGEGAGAASELIADRWKKLGIDVKVTSDTANAQNTVMFQSGDFDAYWVGFNVNLPYQIVPFVTGETPPKGTNFAAIENQEYTRLSAEATRTTGKPGCTLWNQAEQSLLDRVDVVPVAESVRPYFLNGAEAKTDGWLQLPVPTSIRLVK